MEPLEERIYDMVQEFLEENEEESPEEKLDKLIDAVRCLAKNTGRLGVGVAIMASNDPSLENANDNYFEMVAENIGKEICDLVQARSVELF